LFQNLNTIMVHKLGCDVSSEVVTPISRKVGIPMERVQTNTIVSSIFDAL
jgi:hypothetical protein